MPLEIELTAVSERHLVAVEAWLSAVKGLVAASSERQAARAEVESLPGLFDEDVDIQLIGLLMQLLHAIQTLVWCLLNGLDAQARVALRSCTEAILRSLVVAGDAEYVSASLAAHETEAGPREFWHKYERPQKLLRRWETLERESPLWEADERILSIMRDTYEYDSSPHVHAKPIASLLLLTRPNEEELPYANPLEADGRPSGDMVDVLNRVLFLLRYFVARFSSLAIGADGTELRRFPEEWPPAQREEAYWFETGLAIVLGQLELSGVVKLVLGVA